MNKKSLVKKIIDDLVKEGKDFADLTQGSLSMMQELRGVSKTTIKRAKKEYKLEKIVVQGNYQEQAIKRKIYKYLERHPKSALSDLREALPQISPKKVSEYHRFWKKKQEKMQQKGTKQIVEINPRKLKEMIFQFLDENPNILIEDLYRSFPDANQSSVSSYFGHWKKKQKNTETGKEGGLFQAITKYLDNHSDSSIDHLKQSFPDVPKKSLEIYHNLWLKKHQSESKDSVTIENVVQKFVEPLKGKGKRPENPLKSEKSEKKTPKTAGNVPVSVRERKILEAFSTRDKRQVSNTMTVGRPNTETTELSDKRNVSHARTGIRRVEKGMEMIAKSDLRIIENLKNKIQQQKATISELDREYTVLKRSRGKFFKELEGMSKEELIEIKGFISTYLSGLKRF